MSTRIPSDELGKACSVLFKTTLFINKMRADGGGPARTWNGQVDTNRLFIDLIRPSIFISALSYPGKFSGLSMLYKYSDGK